ncbi:hypothetical protein WJX72_000619 [[Myrmecia] bisecta]|uniref:Pre-mRNA cleavage factor Im 25 kDa subunit n=1 Tax=[Myrmecia] bisecta TaxID=41462 RepID=A0AAW1R535_9CHLO
MTTQSALTVFPVQNYNFGIKDAKVEKDSSIAERLQRMQQKYQREGTRRSVDAILLVHEHNHPHVLLLQIGAAFFKLPGGRLRPGEDEKKGLERKLSNHLSPTSEALLTEWEVGECVSVFWRPNFEPALYPYLPAHITKPKEVKKLFVVPLPERCYFAVPKNLKLIAVPLFELYNNAERYGPVISAVPHLVSRFKVNLAGGHAPSLGPSPLALPAPEQQRVSTHVSQQPLQQQVY